MVEYVLEQIARDHPNESELCLRAGVWAGWFWRHVTLSNRRWVDPTAHLANDDTEICFTWGSEGRRQLQVYLTSQSLQMILRVDPSSVDVLTERRDGDRENGAQMLEAYDWWLEGITEEERHMAEVDQIRSVFREFLFEPFDEALTGRLAAGIQKKLAAAGVEVDIRDTASQVVTVRVTRCYQIELTDLTGT